MTECRYSFQIWFFPTQNTDSLPNRSLTSG